MNLIFKKLFIKPGKLYKVGMGDLNHFGLVDKGKRQFDLYTKIEVSICHWESTENFWVFTFLH